MVCPKCGMSEIAHCVSFHDEIMITCGVCGHTYFKFRKERWERSANDDDWMDHYVLDDPDLKDEKFGKIFSEIIAESEKASKS